MEKHLYSIAAIYHKKDERLLMNDYVIAQNGNEAKGIVIGRVEKKGATCIETVLVFRIPKEDYV